MNRVLWDSTKEEKKKEKGIGRVKEVRHHKKQCHKKKKKRESTFQFSAIEWSILARLFPSSTKKKKISSGHIWNTRKEQQLKLYVQTCPTPPHFLLCVCVCVCLPSLCANVIEAPSTDCTNKKKKQQEEKSLFVDESATPHETQNLGLYYEAESFFFLLFSFFFSCRDDECRFFFFIHGIHVYAPHFLYM